MSDGNAVNPLEMSDEDFLNLAPPSVEAPVVETPAEEPEKTDPVETPNAGVEKNDPVETPDEEQETPEEPKTTEEGKQEAEVPGSTGSEAKPETNQEVVEEAPDYEKLYKQMLSPIKANGKTIEIRSPEELIQLAQMGANYTKKMQAIQPHRKVLMMLENNGLLDQGKLSYLIDLDKKNPEAIKKLIKDSGIDPLDIDTSVEPGYVAGNHAVSDEEAAFHAAVEDVTSMPTGHETIDIIDKTWDDQSKAYLWSNPSSLSIIQAQRDTGVYDRIVAEMDRQKTLGQISPETPFLQAYQSIGDALKANGAFNDLIAKTTEAEPGKDTPAPKQEPTPVETRAAAPKANVDNGDKARAAAPTRSTPAKAKEVIDWLNMPDDQFLNHMNGRV